MLNNELGNSILTKLNDISERKDKRVDKYLTSLQEILRNNSDNWNESHDVIFKEMVKEVKNSRLVSWVATILFFGVALFLLYYILFYVPDQKKNLIDGITKSNMPVKFEPSSDINRKDKLLIKYDKSDLQTHQLDLINELNLEKIGVYNGLGEAALLILEKSDESDIWLVKPEGRVNEVIGRIKADVDDGNIDRLGELNINDPVGHNDLGEFYLRYIKAPPGPWKEHSETKHNDYQFQYGVKVNGEMVWHNPSIVKSSLDGTTLRGPYILSNKKWEAIYIVNIAAGNYGGTGESSKIYNVTSNVKKLKLN